MKTFIATNGWNSIQAAVMNNEPVVVMAIEHGLSVDLGDYPTRKPDETITFFSATGEQFTYREMLDGK